MNEMTKLTVIFLAGVVVGVLGATSTLFQGEPEQAATEAVTRDAGRQTAAEAGQRPAETAETRVPVEQPAAEPEPADVQAEAPPVEAEPDRVAPESPRTDVEVAEQGEGENGEASAAAEQGAEARVFCMQMENTGQCRCYDAETMAPAEVSAEECRKRLAEE